MATHKRASRIKLAAAITAAVAAAGVTALNSPFAGAAPAEGTVYGLNAQDAVDGSYIVLLDKSASADAKRKLAEEYGGKLKRDYSSSLNGFSAERAFRDRGQASGRGPVRRQGRTEQEVPHQRDPDEPAVLGPGPDRPGRAPRATASTPTRTAAGDGVTAYVIDTGVRISHKDFGGRASYGFNAVDNNDKADDGNGHGTHVAGTIAGTAHGVAKKAKIVAVRVLDNNGSGSTEQVVAGIDWVTKNHKGPSVANLSLGGTADPALDEAVQKAIASGVTFGVAAGNESADAGNSSPAHVKEAITVASSTKDDQQSSFSNFGPVVDLYAPGSDITSDWNTSDTATNTISGTSMATPHVVGAAAVYLAGHKDATPAQVSDALTKGATPDKISNASQGTPNKLLKVVE